MPLTASGIRHYYTGSEGRIKALDGVDIMIGKGETVLLTGRNGSGKSTLLHVLAGLLKPASGIVSRDGKTTALAIQYPERALIEKTAFDDIAFGPKNAGKRSDELSAIVEEAACTLGIMDTTLSMDTRHLSHGQKRLVALAGVFAMKPSYLFLDEPLAGLDAICKRSVMDAIALAARRGSAVVVASHDVGSMLGICSRIVVLDAGRIVMDRAPEALRKSWDVLPGIAMPDTLSLARALESKGVDTSGAWTPEELAGRAFDHLKSVRR